MEEFASLGELVELLDPRIPGKDCPIGGEGGEGS